MKPIKPQEVVVTLPDFVVDAVNSLIQERFRNLHSSFSILQDDIVERILEKGPEGLTRDEIFDKDYLDFEVLYREHGWSVKHDKPGYNETYKAYYTFTPR